MSFRKDICIMESLMDKYERHIVQAPTEYSLCTGCRSCEILCGLIHDGVSSPSYRRLFLDKGQSQRRFYRIMSCQQCADHPCYEACPKKDKAMLLDDNNIVYIKEEECIGCGKCQKSCSFTPPRINIVKSADRTKRKAKKCDLCRGRKEGPVCVEYCPALCLGVSDEKHLWDEIVTGAG